MAKYKQHTDGSVIDTETMTTIPPGHREMAEVEVWIKEGNKLEQAETATEKKARTASDKLAARLAGYPQLGEFADAYIKIHHGSTDVIKAAGEAQMQAYAEACFKNKADNPL